MIGAEQGVNIAVGTIFKKGIQGLLPVLPGGLVGGMALETGSRATKMILNHTPGLMGKLLQSLGHGGYERGQEAGRDLLIRTVLKTLEDASLIEMGAFFLALIEINPTTRLIKNTAGVAALSYVAYKGISAGTSRFSSWLVMQASKKMTIDTIQKRLLSLLADRYISIDTYNNYLLDITKTNNLYELLEISKVLAEKVFTRVV